MHENYSALHSAVQEYFGLEVSRDRLRAELWCNDNEANHQLSSASFAVSALLISQLKSLWWGKDSPNNWGSLAQTIHSIQNLGPVKNYITRTLLKWSFFSQTWNKEKSFWLDDSLVKTPRPIFCCLTMQRVNPLQLEIICTF